MVFEWCYEAVISLSQECFPMGACRYLILGGFGIFLAKNLSQSSKFSEGIFFTWPVFSHFEINLDRLAGQPIKI